MLFNGNLVSRNKYISYKLFNKSINKYSKKGKIVLNTIVYNPLLVKSSLEDSWISSFVDTKEYFNVSLKSKDNNYNIVFDLAHKNLYPNNNEDELSILLKLFKVGKIRKHSLGENINYYRVSGLSDTSCLFSYFDKHQLKSKKLKSYLLWCNLHFKLLNKEYLNLILKHSLKVLCSKVNNTWD